MKYARKPVNIIIRQNHIPFTTKIISLAIFVAVLFLSVGAAPAQTKWPQIVLYKDCTPISYETHGSGETTLIFIHGWSCDARYWREQLPYFSKKYRVVTIDLAGHGHSGSTRSQYTMKAFGEDVQAVVEKTGSHNVILS